MRTSHKIISDYLFFVGATLNAMLLVANLATGDWRKAVQVTALLGIGYCVWRALYAFNRAVGEWKEREIARIEGRR